MSVKVLCGLGIRRISGPNMLFSLWVQHECSSMLKSYPFGCRTLKSFKHVESHNKICVSVIWGGVGVGWGKKRSCQLEHEWKCNLCLGVGKGWGGAITFMLRYGYLLLHLHSHVMLRYGYLLL